MSAVLDSTDPIYRFMDLNDLSHVMEIERVAYQYPWSLAIFQDCIKAGYHCWIAEIEGEIIGYAVFINAVQECHLLNLCINPTLQGRGLGRKLLANVLSNAKDYNATCVFLEVRPSNKYAVDLYESEGFNEVGIRKKYYPSGNGREDAVIYAKEL
ncbi:MAG: ribosomal protein S18-alanine N-acetyltransferase [Gammaproteobacteria bacterium]|nr:ribosomal protein S18-alanine N-acetyltransferase [Gammaproteobacteria bacterium]